MGDCQNEDLRVQFDRRLKLKFLGSKVTTDAGLLAYRELDEALGLTEMPQDLLRDSRVGGNKQHQLVPLLRQSIYSRLAGYEDVNDAERLAIDPAMRHVVGGRATLADKYAASTSEVGRQRDRDPQHQGQPEGADGPFRKMDRQGPPAKAAEGVDPGHGQFGERDVRRAGRLGLQRPLRLHLLPPVAYVQPVWRPGTCYAAAW